MRPALRGPSHPCLRALRPAEPPALEDETMTRPRKPMSEVQAEREALRRQQALLETMLKRLERTPARKTPRLKPAPPPWDDD